MKIFLSKLLIFTTILAGSGLVVYHPMTQIVPQTVSADDHIDLPFNIKSSVENTISAVKNTLTAIATGDLRIKEYILDKIAWVAAKTYLQKMSSDILQWVNSGFGGDPAFVTNLNQYILQAGDESAEQFIESDRWRVVSQPFHDDIEHALTVNIRENALNDAVPASTFDDSDGDLESLLSGNFKDGGGWPAWFELTSQPQNTPYGAYLASERELRDVVRKDQLEEQQLLEFGDGFFSDTYCYNEADCVITTPGEIIKDITERQLDVGTDALLEADELNEVIASLLNQLAQQALTGVNGLLGLGGGSGSNYSDLSSGYLEDMRSATTTTTFDSGNPIAQSVKEAQILVDFYTKVLDEEARLQAEIDEARTQYPGCFNLTTGSLDEYVDTAETELPELEEILATLIELETRYDEAVANDAPQEQEAVIEEYQRMLDDGLSQRLADATRVQIETEPEFDDAVAELERRIDRRINHCQNLASGS